MRINDIFVSKESPHEARLSPSQTVDASAPTQD